MARPRKDEEAEAAPAAVVDEDRYESPRESADPDHKDAGQLYVEEHNEDAG